MPLKTLIMVQVLQGKFSTGKLLQIIDMFDDVCKEELHPTHGKESKRMPGLSGTC